MYKCKLIFKNIFNTRIILTKALCWSQRICLQSLQKIVASFSQLGALHTFLHLNGRVMDENSDKLYLYMCTTLSLPMLCKIWIFYKDDVLCPFCPFVLQFAICRKGFIVFPGSGLMLIKQHALITAKQ